VIGDELAVEQAIAADAQPRDQMRQRHLGSIGRAAEHALAEIGAAERHAIKAADEIAADVAMAPDLDRMGVAVAVEQAIGLLDLAVDPGFRPIRRRPRAGGDDALERHVRRHGETIRPQRLAQGVGEVKAVQRQDTALLGLYPEDVGGIAAVRHREDADGIGAQQQIGVDRLGGRPASTPQHQPGRRRRR